MIRPRRFRAPAAALGLIALALLPACSDDGDSGAFCERLGETRPLGEILGELDSSDPAGVEDRLETALDQFQELEADAPGAIRDDVARVRQGVELVLDAVEENPDDLPAARAAITGELDQLSGLANAGEAVVDYARDECDLDLGSEEAPSPDGADDPGVTTTTAAVTTTTAG